jgi:Protein of unknown function (DUF3251)
MWASKLEERIKSLEVNDNVRKWTDEAGKQAYLTPGDGLYQVIEFDLGRLTVALDDVQPYANGSRVTLRFGIPASASLVTPSADLEWGARGAGDRQSRHVEFSKDLLPGAWTRVGLPP